VFPARIRESALGRRRDSTGGGLAAAATVVALVTVVLYPLQSVDPGVSSHGVEARLDHT
jgi:hypothetical protein